MKGSLDIEFILSVMVFLSTISFVTYIIIGNIPMFHGDSVSDDLRSRAYEISQLVMLDQGYPENWTNTTVQRIGLSNGTSYVMSMQKITNLATLCPNNYTHVKSLLGQDFRSDIRIKIVDERNSTVLDCRPMAISLIRQEFNVVRFAVLDDTRIAKVMVSVL